MAKIRLTVEALGADGAAREDMKTLAAAFGKWDSVVKKEQTATAKQTIVHQRSQYYKSAIQTLNQSFNPRRKIERAFDTWRNIIVL